MFNNSFVLSNFSISLVNKFISCSNSVMFSFPPPLIPPLFRVKKFLNLPKRVCIGGGGVSGMSFIITNGSSISFSSLLP